MTNTIAASRREESLAAIKTWRDRIGAGADFPLHAPTDVERAMVAEIAELRSCADIGPAARDVLAERLHQVEIEGYDTEHDDAHPNGEIAAYAAFYAMPPAAREWPATETGYGATLAQAIVPHGWLIPPNDDRRRELVKAGALILAEIERIDRVAN